MVNREFSTVRIIGGKWRGRSITFPLIDALRPTPNRVRETLFNWLQQTIVGARCLDLFSGSGALGFEALSRGAEFVTFVDVSADVSAAIKCNAENFGLDNYAVHQVSVPSTIIGNAGAPYDVVFLDPPFNQGLLLPTCCWLREENMINNDTIIYFEAEKSYIHLMSTATEIELIRHKSTQSMCYGLLRLC